MIAGIGILAAVLTFIRPMFAKKVEAEEEKLVKDSLDQLLTPHRGSIICAAD